MHATPLPSSSRRLPAVLWLTWAIAAAASVQLAPNPVYVSLVIASAAMVVRAHRFDARMARAFPLLVTVGLVFAGLRVVLNALTTHGVGRVLFRLPEATLPRLLGGFVVGGTVEQPVLVQAAAEGWAIVAILAAFGAFNAVVSHYELVRAAPRAFYELGLAVTVAIAFLPSTLASIAAVREADLARTGGTVVRRGRLVRQIAPVLESGMERAVSLAESMDSRGFGRQSSRGEVVGGWLGLVAMLLLGGAFVALVAQERVVAVTCAAAGVAAMVAAVVVTSSGTTRSAYRRRRLTGAERVLTLVPLGAPMVIGAAAWLGDTSLRWPSGPAGAPAVAVVPLLGLALLAATPLGTRPTATPAAGGVR